MLIHAQGHKALKLVQEAERVFRRVLGPTHPRTEVATRNIAHLQHKAVNEVCVYVCMCVCVSVSPPFTRSGVFHVLHSTREGPCMCVYVCVCPCAHCVHRLSSSITYPLHPRPRQHARKCPSARHGTCTVELRPCNVLHEYRLVLAHGSSQGTLFFNWYEMPLFGVAGRLPHRALQRSVPPHPPRPSQPPRPRRRAGRHSPSHPHR